jgi:polyadenylate-binding protein
MIPTNAPPPPTPHHSASLYVGDLNLDVTEALLFEIFNAVGPVASIRVCRDAVTRRSLGYAYVNFHNVADAERALDTMNYTMIKGKPCRIMWSQRDPSLRKSGVGNIFVKNLDTTIDNKALYDTFSLFGNILSCKVAQDGSGNSKGYGYVHYETAEAAEEAIQKINGMLIANKEVFVGTFQRQSDRPGHADWTNCYVKNIPDDWDETKLKELFTKYGEVDSCVIMMKDEAKALKEGETKSKGFGFVNFKESDAAKAAVEDLNEKKMAAVEGEEPKELYVGRAMKKSERERELRGKFEQLKIEQMNKYQGVNLYVKNLEDTILDDELREHFAVLGNITSARVMKDKEGKSKGFGFVCFSTPEEATKAVTEMNNKLLKNKPIYVALAQRKEVRRAQLEAQHTRGPGGPRGPMGMGGQPPMYGGAPLMYGGMPNQMPMYPQQMMGGPRGPRGPMPPYGRGVPGYQMPGYGMPMQRGGHRGPRGMPRGGMPRGGPGNFQYTANARNQPGGGAPQGGMPMQGGAPPPQQQAPPAPEAMQPLTPAALADADPQQQKNMIGERLYPLIHAAQPELAGKITGMLLEMDNGELLHLLESPDALKNKIDEALQVLEQHTEGEA